MKNRWAGLISSAPLLLSLWACQGKQAQLPNSPNEVFLAQFKATQEGDVSTVKALTVKSHDLQSQASKSNLLQLASMAPKQVEILNSEFAGDKATLKIKGTGGQVIEGQAVGTNGTVKLAKEDGQWKVEDIDYSK